MKIAYFSARVIRSTVGILVLSWLMNRPCLAAQESPHTAQGLEQEVEKVYGLALEALENEEYGAAESHFNQVLKAHPIFQEPSGRTAWHGLGLVLERQEEPLSAVRTMFQGRDSLVNADLRDFYLDYDLARMIAEYRVEEYYSQVTGLMYDVMNHISPEHQSDLWERLKANLGFMLEKSKQKQLDEIERSGDEPGRVLYTFFRREDPNPITEQNELFVRIFQRAREARELYTSFSSPQGFDDRGKIFVRLGRPYKVHRHRSGLLEEVGYAIYPYEIWFYSQIDYDIYFTFVRERGTGDFELKDGPEAVFGTFYRGRRAFQTRSFLTRGSRGEISSILHFLVYEDLAPIHDTFRERLYRMQEQISAEEVGNYARRHFVHEDSDHAASLDTLAPRVAYYAEDVYETLPVDLSMVKFLDEDDQIRAEMYYSIPNEALFFDTDGRGEHTRLVGEIGLFDEDFNLVISDSLDHFWIASSPEEREKGVFISQWNVVLQPDNYNLYFRIENPNSKKMAIIQADFEIEPFSETELCLSDLQLARDVQPSEEGGLFNKRGLFIKPLAYNSIPLGQSFFVYFEIYHLSPDSDGRTSYRVEYSLLGVKKTRGFLGLFGSRRKKEQIFQESVQRTGQDFTQSEYRMLAFDDLKSGEYRLKIAVTDLNSTEEASEEITIHLYE